MRSYKRFLSFIISAVVLGNVLVSGNIPLSGSMVIEASAASSSKLKAPTGITTSSTKNSVTLQWKKTSGADAYRVYMYNIKNDEYEKYKDVTGTKCTIKGLKSDTAYKFKLAALINKNGKKSVQTKSGKIEAKTKKAVRSLLAAPKNIKAEPDLFSVSLKWDPVSGADEYVVYIYDPSTGKYKEYDTVIQNKITVEDLDSDVYYRFKIACLVDFAEQTLSEVVTARTKAITKRSSPAEWKEPVFGTSMNKVLYECGIAKYEDVIDDLEECDDYGHIYLGYVIYDGREMCIYLDFNKENRFCGYTLVFDVNQYSDYLSLKAKYDLKYGTSDEKKENGNTYNHWYRTTSIISLGYFPEGKRALLSSNSVVYDDSLK